MKNKRWPNWIPRLAVHIIIDRLHVSVSDEEIEKIIRSKASKDAKPRMVKTVVEYAIHHHHENRDLYSRVMSGRL